MARKKSRVPSPPRVPDNAAQRPVQAPRVRKEVRAKTPRPPGAPGRTRALLVGGAGLLMVVGVVVGLVVAFGGGDGNATSALAAAGCQTASLPEQERRHVDALPTEFHYNSYPPSSGLHSPQWALWGFYDRPVPFLNSTHNLEHGGILVHYGKDVPQGTIDQIRAWYDSDPTAMLVAPLPENEPASLDSRVTLTAWGYWAACPGFDQAAFDSFRDSHIFEGPERFPADRLQPGM